MISLYFVLATLALVIIVSSSLTIPRQADAFVESIATTNTHADFYNTAYKNWTLVVNALNDLGLRHVRDSAHHVINYA
jgi:hypothetical protein